MEAKLLSSVKVQNMLFSFGMLVPVNVKSQPEEGAPIAPTMSMYFLR